MTKRAAYYNALDEIAEIKTLVAYQHKSERFKNNRINGDMLTVDPAINRMYYRLMWDYLTPYPEQIMPFF
jgi:uncharacterized Fe-S cluster-containing radical SAM superfamily protein